VVVVPQWKKMAFRVSYTITNFSVTYKFRRFPASLSLYTDLYVNLLSWRDRVCVAGSWVVVPGSKQDQ
jgi:hypothetical protein